MTHEGPLSPNSLAVFRSQFSENTANLHLVLFYMERQKHNNFIVTERCFLVILYQLVRLMLLLSNRSVFVYTNAHNNHVV